MSSNLFPHQAEGITFLKEKGRAILADEMGLGKTRQAIVAAIEAGDLQHAEVVVCPASLKVNWQREINAVDPAAAVRICSGTVNEESIANEWKLAQLDGRRFWIVINYDILGKNAGWLTEWGESDCLGTLILDEVHYIKGQSIRAKAALQVAAQAPRVYALTGTPILNRPIEFFNTLRAIGHPLTQGHPPSKARKDYAVRYCNAFLRRMGPYRFWDESGASNLDELQAFVQPWMLRRKKAEVLDLPPKIVTTLDVELSKDDRARYESAWQDYVQWVANHPELGKDLGNVLMAQQLVELQKLKQVCSLAKVPRIAADVRNAIEQGEKVIVFSQYTETIHQLAQELRKEGVVTLTGADDQNARQRAVDAFQGTDSVKVFVANLKAGGVGLTLTAATIVMFADMDWSPEQHAQAEDRAHRIGQGGTVNVYYYVTTGTIEEDIVRILEAKKEIIKALVEGQAGRMKGVSMAEEIARLTARKAIPA